QPSGAVPWEASPFTARRRSLLIDVYWTTSRRRALLIRYPVLGESTIGQADDAIHVYEDQLCEVLKLTCPIGF
ncbi:hypothetical protein, partial [Natrinema sp. HArc-T2]|uniref:hypothetical protein n=1 Tax=Natrinema sp. HArc-T2 TaxID=3242701 RepID=UPI00359DD425